MNKKISIICCLYNTKPILFKNCINSILRQTYNNYELIIINDGSTEYIEENIDFIYSLNNDKIKLFNRFHEGKAQSLNYGIFNALGEYICICDSDDSMFSNRLEHQFRFLEENKNYDYVSNAVITSDSQIFPNNFDISQEISNYNCHYLNNHNCCMFRRSIINKIPFLFQQYYDYIEDLAFNVLIYKHGVKCYYDNTVLQTYTFNLSQCSHKIALQPYYKESSDKFYNLLNNLEENNKILSCVIICDDSWEIELEKTILSIKTTSNSVNIIVYDISNNIYQKNISHLYNCKYIGKFNNKFDCISNSIIIEETLNNILYILEPCRFYNQNWDIYLSRKYKYKYYNSLFIPNSFKIIKYDNNFYKNEERFDNENLIYYSKLLLGQLDLIKQVDGFKFNHDYSFEEEIPVFNSNIFFTTKEKLNDINLTLPIFGNNLKLFNIILSLKYWLSGSKVYIDKEFKVGELYKEIIKDNNYYENYYKTINFLYSELNYIYNDILEKTIGNDNLSNLINNHLYFVDVYKKSFNNKYNIKNNINNFLKYNNK